MYKLLCLVLCFTPVLCQFGFFTQRDNRRVTPASPFGLVNVIPDPSRIRNTLTGILHFQPGNVANNRPSYDNGPNNYDNRPNNYDNYYNIPNNYDNYYNRPNNYDNYNNRPNNYDNYSNRPNNYDNYQTNPPSNVRFPVNVPNDDVNFEPQTTSNEVNQNPGFVSGSDGQNPGFVSGTADENPGFVSGQGQGFISGSAGENPGFVSGQGQGFISGSAGENPGFVSGTVGQEQGFISGSGDENPGFGSGTAGQDQGFISGSGGENPGFVSGTAGQDQGFISGSAGENPGFVSGTAGQDQGLISGSAQNPGFVSGTVGQDTTQEPSYGKDSGFISGTQGLDSGNKFGEENGGLISGTVETPKQEDVAFGNRNAINSGTLADSAFEDPCRTVDGANGNCIPLTSCEPYVQLIKTARTNVKSRMTLQRSQCGFDGSVPKVCCPLPGIPSQPPTEATTTTTTTTTTAATAVVKTADDSDYVSAFPEPPVCGVSGGQFGKVVGGVDAKLGDFPWIALLGYTNKRDQSTRWRCGGSLITDKHVLTAAHCIQNHEDELYVVRLGELDLSRDDDGASPIDVLIKRQIKHEQYSPSSFENDIAVLLLQNTVQFSKLINPICLPFTDGLRTQKFERLTPMIAGWGDVQFRGPSATHLQVVQLPVQTNPLCKKSYEKYPKQVIDDRVLCAGYREGGKDACQGDSGGPLMLPHWNNVTFKVFFYQIGVVSYGKNCAEAGFPGVYSRLTHFIPWLEKVVLGRFNS
ncbi:uncharacterized protein LOC121735881 isoform X2 [Aricia agestis]|uniref:uncharacterized protein LOC121735881 isoform X2 n=1 Tax=Aricia agestis TaxID=91739 RepID=UPI001C2096C8|nr:uncharacterized protein LOC121735881 isoform X2 [Aricia agestis]